MKTDPRSASATTATPDDRGSRAAARPSWRLQRPTAPRGSPRRPGSAGPGPRWPIVAVSLVVLAAMELAGVWVFLVPIFQGPDEPCHLDYAFCLKDHRRLPAPSRTDPARCRTRRSTPTPRTSPAAPARPDHLPPRGQGLAEYGTAAFFAAIDRDALRGETIRIDRSPSLTKVYPFGYYAILACSIALLHRVRDSVVFLFFGARLLSVLLLGCSLALSYGIGRRLRLGPAGASRLTAIIGFFPLTTLVSSYVQPDNLGFALVSLCLYLALVARDRGYPVPIVAGLGAALGLLLVTKLHFCLAVALPIAAMLASDLARPRHRRWRRILVAALLVVPGAVLEGIHLRTVAGTKTYYEYAAATATHALRARRVAGGPERLPLRHDAPLVLGRLRLARRPMVRWPRVRRLRPLRRPGGDARRHRADAGAARRVASRLVVVARRGRPAAAVRIACSNPVLNSYFLFFAAMLLLRPHRQLLRREGRNWLPSLLPIFLTATVYAPSALTLRTSRRPPRSR